MLFSESSSDEYLINVSRLSNWLTQNDAKRLFCSSFEIQLWVVVLQIPLLSSNRSFSLFLLNSLLITSWFKTLLKTSSCHALSWSWRNLSLKTSLVSLVSPLIHHMSYMAFHNGPWVLSNSCSFLNFLLSCAESNSGIWNSLESNSSQLKQLIVLEEAGLASLFLA